MKLIIVRHGETGHNASGTVQGHTQSKLNEKGLDQIRRVAERLKTERIDAIFSSDLDRCSVTAREIAKFHSIPLIHTPELRELSYGVWEGKPIAEFRSTRENSGLSRHKFRPEGGENYEDAKIRIEHFLKKLETSHKGKTVLLVTHGALIRVFLSVLLKKPLDAFMDITIGNTAVSIVEIGDKDHKTHLINDVGHL